MMPDDPLADIFAARQAVLAAQTAAVAGQVNTQIALTDYFKPAGALYETIPHWSGFAAYGPPDSGTLNLIGIGLPAGLIIRSITFVSGPSNYPTGGTHLWYGLYDSAYNQLATTVDDLGATWLTSNHPLTIAQDANGATTSFTTTYEGLYYLGICNVATTPVGLSNGLTQIGFDVPPFLFGDSTTGLTGPPAFPFVATALLPNALAGLTYAYVS